MMTLPLTALQSILNSYLKLDPDTIQRLNQLDGKIIQIDIEDWSTKFFIMIHGARLELHKHSEQTANTIIRGTLNSLVKTGLAKASQDALFKNHIQIEGDIPTGEIMREVLAHIDIDWEEQLAKILGDIVAHKITTTAQSIKTSAVQTLQTLQLNFKQFIQLELKALPTRAEVTHFSENVAELRHAVERLEARINRWQNYQDFDL